MVRETKLVGAKPAASGFKGEVHSKMRSPEAPSIPRKEYDEGVHPGTDHEGHDHSADHPPQRGDAKPSAAPPDYTWSSAATKWRWPGLKDG